MKTQNHYITIKPFPFQVVGGGRCLVFWRPDAPTPHRVDIKFNGEPVPSSPFIFHVAPAQRVTVNTAQIGKLFLKY